MTDNILDKIIKSQEDQKKSDLSPQELVDFLLRDLNSREKEVIKARYGLDRADKQTLENIGQKFNITRERVRQIENSALKKARQTAGWQEKLADLLSLTLKYINKNGYVQREDSLFAELLENSQDEDVDKNCLNFIFTKFLDEHLEPVSIVHTEKAWKIKDKNLDHYDHVVDGMRNILTKKNEPLELNQIIQELEQEIIDEKVKNLVQEIEDWEKAVRSYLEVSKHFRKNLFDKWGLVDWRLVNPKRMRDKIYLVLAKDKQPLHYKKIADRINQEEFDNKTAHPATIHNELILDKRFVLIGRGIYALAEWGYKPGVIVEVIADVLKQAGSPLTREEITQEVLKRRMVKQGSINLTLANKEMFERLADGKYSLKDNS